jgi:Fe-S-cluster-containing dehydrogenase component
MDIKFGQYSMIINLQRCIGCYTCYVACQIENNLSSNSYVHIKNVEGRLKGKRKINESIIRYWIPIFCMQCAEAPCLSICPTGAIVRRDNGIIDINAGKCVGCKKCLSTCPYDSFIFFSDRNVVGKCNLCFERIRVHQEPFCVVCCPTRALTLINNKENDKLLSELLQTKKIIMLRNAKRTRPNVYYIAPKRWQKKIVILDGD